MPSPAHPRPPPQAPASWAHGDAAFMRVRGLEGGRQPERWGPESLWPASWHAKRESDMGLPAKKKSASESKGSRGQANKETGDREGSTRLHRPSESSCPALQGACSWVAQPFPWHLVLLSQQPQDGPALGSAEAGGEKRLF